MHLVVFTCGRKRTPSAFMRCCMRAMLCCMRERSMMAAGVSRVARVARFKALSLFIVHQSR
jgi:hypothetical protein